MKKWEIQTAMKTEQQNIRLNKEQKRQFQQLQKDHERTASQLFCIWLKEKWNARKKTDA